MQGVDAMSQTLFAAILAGLTVAVQTVRGGPPSDDHVPSAARAADTLSAGPDTLAVELQPLIVSHSRRLERRAEAPVAISAVSRKEMEDVKANSLDQVLNQTSGVLTVDLGNEQHKMAIRQPMTTRSLFLYLEDGIPVRPTGVFNHNALIEVNMAGLERVEVIRGPSSSLYGSEAVGGAVNFITRSPSLHPEGKVSLQANDIGYRRADLALSHTLGKAGLALGGYYGGRTDRGFLSSPRDHDGFDKLGFNAAADYLLSPETRVKATAAYVRYESDMTGALDSANFADGNFSSLHTFTWRNVDALRGRLSVDHDWSDRRRTQGAVFYRGGTIGQNPSYRIRNVAGTPSLAHGTINENIVNSIGLWSQHEEGLPFLKASVTAGVYGDHSLNEVCEHYIRIARDPATGVYLDYEERRDSMLTDYRVDLTNAATYAQLKLSPLERLVLVGALRYDHFLYDYSNVLDRSAFSGAPDQEQTFSRLTPKLGATFDFGSNRGAYVNYSQGFVPPQVGELYRGVKVPVLEPSHFHNYEAGAWHAWSRRISAELNTFYIEGRGELVNVRLEDGSTETRNSGETGHRGLEWGIKADPVRDLSLRFNGAYSEHEFHAFADGAGNFGGKEMNEAPNWFWNAAVTVKPRFLQGSRAGLEWQRVGEYWMDPANTRKYPGYDLFNLRLGYTLKGIEAWLNVHNLLDGRYATSAYYTPGSGNRPGSYSYSVGEDRSINLGLAYHLDRATPPRGRP
jgi:outer membrane receptor protein involved in Fe transport